MAKDYKLVICDIDGTLVGRNRLLSQEAREVIRQVHAQNKYFGIASGRPIDEVSHLVREVWKFEDKFEIIIGMNGAELLDNIHVTFDEYFKLSREAIKEIIELMAPFNLNACIYKPGAMMVQTVTDQIHQSVSRSGKEIILAKSIEEFYSEDNAKIMFRTDPENLDRAEEFAQQHPSNLYKAFRTGPTILEFCDPRVSKAYALQKFCEKNNVELNQCIAFGDTSNDNDMLAASGLGVCLLNGSDDTKEIADVITEKTNEEDGFVYFMEKHILSTN